MRKFRRALPALVIASTILAGCSAQQASNKTSEVANDTGSALGTVVDGVKAVVVWPFHVIGDLFS